MSRLEKLKKELADLEDAVDVMEPEFQEFVREEIVNLKAEIAELEKGEKEKEQMKQEAEKKIEKLEDELKKEDTPDKVKKEIKEQVQDVKKDLKDADKEAKRERAAVEKKVAKAVAKKRGRGRPRKEEAAKPKAGRGRPKKVAAKPVAKKKVTKRKSKADVKYEKALSNLQKLVNKTAELKEKYKGSGVDLDRDAARKAKPFGWRLKGNNYRRPTKAEIKNKEAYWEGRPNRADVKRSKFPKL